MTDDEQADDKPEPSEGAARAKRRTSFWRELPILLGVAIVVAIVVRAFLLQTFYIPSPSMEHTLNIDDRVLVNKIVYRFRAPERGEIVVFKAPLPWRSDPADEDFIKRVIGVGGDRIVCCDERQRLVINGEPLDEPYLYSNGVSTDVAADQPFDVTIPEGRLFVLGDHRSASGDSAARYERTGDIQASTISEDAVIGRAFWLFWPFDRADWLSIPESHETIPASPAGRRVPASSQPG